MKTTTSSVLILFLCVDFAGAADNKATLPDGEAKTTIEKGWKSSSVVSIPLGNVSIKQNTLSIFKGWEAAGIVQLKNQKDLTKGFTGWDDFLKQTQFGVAAEAQIQLTDRGRKLNVSSDTNNVQISMGSFRIKKITSNETLQRDFDRYCLITGLHQAEWTPEYVQLLQHLNAPVPAESRKFRALFKFDKITDQWKFIAHDNESEDAEFTENTLQQALDAHK